jgi:hypothetical protein
MPQLDIGIFFVEFFFNFFCFWLIYLIKAKIIFPSINKSIKLRKYKIKKINNSLNLYFNNLNILNVYLQINKNIFEFLLIKNLFFYFLKLKIIYFLILKYYNNLFLKNNNKLFSNFLNKQILISKI